MSPSFKWKKLGKIFDPTNYTFFCNSVGYAQSPQTLILKDRVRVYFSTRQFDKMNKYLSHIAYVDFNIEMNKVIKVSNKEIIPLGDHGTFDEHGIFPMNILKEKDRILAFTSGINRKVSVQVDTSIGIAASYDNGETFKKIGSGPVLTSSLREPFLVADGFVKKIGDTYYMWYIYGLKWKKFQPNSNPERIYKIACAHSKDALNWTKNSRQIIESRLEEECQALPTVIKIGKMYHMFFCYRNAFKFREDKSKSYKIGYAFSKDLKIWKRADNLSGFNNSKYNNSWDSDMQCYPHVFKLNDKIFILYNGNDFGARGFGLSQLNNPEDFT
jgi:predicted GH43/DUF377 family glycosyl hydrolase